MLVRFYKIKQTYIVNLNIMVYAILFNKLHDNS